MLVGLNDDTYDETDLVSYNSTLVFTAPQAGTYTITVTGGPTNGDDIWTSVSSGVFAVGLYTDTVSGGNGNDQIYSGWGNDRSYGNQAMTF